MKALARDAITPEVLGRALRHLRTSRGLTQTELAAKAGANGSRSVGRLCAGQVSDFERGRCMPSMKSLFNFLTGCCGCVDFLALQHSIEVALNLTDGAFEPSALAERFTWMREELTKLSHTMEPVLAEVEALLGRVEALEDTPDVLDIHASEGEAALTVEAAQESEPRVSAGKLHIVRP